jgi:hypothetical protein
VPVCPLCCARLAPGEVCPECSLSGEHRVLVTEEYARRAIEVVERRGRVRERVLALVVAGLSGALVAVLLLAAGWATIGAEVIVDDLTALGPVGLVVGMIVLLLGLLGWSWYHQRPRPRPEPPAEDPQRRAVVAAEAREAARTAEGAAEARDALQGAVEAKNGDARDRARRLAASDPSNRGRS